MITLLLSLMVSFFQCCVYLMGRWPRYVYLCIYLLMNLVWVFYLFVEWVLVHTLLVLPLGVCSWCSILLFLILANDRHGRKSLQVRGDPSLACVQLLELQSLWLFIQYSTITCDYVQVSIFQSTDHQTQRRFHSHIIIVNNNTIANIELIETTVFYCGLANIVQYWYSIYIYMHSMFVLVLLLTLLHAYAYLMIESGRLRIQSGNMIGVADAYEYKIAYMSNHSRVCSIVLSLNSFGYGRSDPAIAVQLASINYTYFVINSTANVYQVAYIVGGCNQLYQYGTISASFPKLNILADPTLPITHYLSAQTDTNINSGQSALMTIQPFISAIFYAPNSNISYSYLQISANYDHKNITVLRSPQIVRIIISFISYKHFGDPYMSIHPYDNVTIFNYKYSYKPIFVGVRSVSISNNIRNISKFNMTSSLWAESMGIRPTLYIITNATATCTQSYSPTACLYSNITNTLQFQRPYQSNMVKLVQYQQQCNKYYPLNFTKPIGLTCQQCNANNNFIKYSDGSCVCRQGYYQKYPQITVSPTCYSCYEHNDCPFVIYTSMAIKKVDSNSTQYIQLKIIINQDYPSAYPYRTQYSSLSIQTAVNDFKVANSIQWTTSNQALMTLRQFKFSNNYKVNVNIKNSIFMKNNQNIYLTPSQSSQQLNFNRPQTTKFIADSIGTFTTFAPSAALISALVGSKVNIFSFVQVSSILYLSSFIGWEDFGSVERVSLSQSVFKLTPTNLFASLNSQIPIALMRSDDNKNTNKMLDSFDNMLYTSVVPQFLISSLIQILAIQIIISILIKVFPHPKRILGYYMTNNNSVIKWWKKPFLIDLINSKQMTLKEYFSQMIEKVRTKRFIFYTTLINSQLAFHSFMIFSQFSITMSTHQQVLNMFFSLFLLSVLIAIPCIGPHSPMILFKSIAIVYKKRTYKIGQLYTFYILCLVQVIIYGASVALFDFSVYQCAGVVCILSVKLFLMWGYLKRIQLAKHIFLLLYFSLLGGGTYFPIQYKVQMEIVAIALMFSVCGIEILKIIRSTIVAFLGLLKEPASIKGLAIANRVIQKRNLIQQTHQQ